MYIQLKSNKICYIISSLTYMKLKSNKPQTIIMLNAYQFQIRNTGVYYAGIFLLTFSGL